MEKNNEFVLEIPSFLNPESIPESTEDSNIANLKDEQINDENRKNIESLVMATEDLISNCMGDHNYNGNEDPYFINLTYVCHKISLKLETHKIEKKINELEDKSKTIESKQVDSEKQSNNLIYNILGFIASYSIVSAAVVTFEKVKSIEDIIIFMTFIAFILITTLIALNNFYKENACSQKKLTNNYFLWKALLLVLIGMIMYKGVIYVKTNITTISEGIGRGIEEVRQKYENIESE